MDSSLARWVAGAALGLSAAASPGLFQTFLINQTLTGGWRSGVPVAFAVLVSDPPIVITILLLLNQLPDAFIHAIGLAGGFFALYLASGFWRSANRQQVQNSDRVDPAGAVEASASSPQGTRATATVGAWSILGKGALMNLLSPGPYMFWTMVLGPTLLQAWKSSPAEGLSFLLSFYLLFIGGMLGLVGLFHQVQRLGPRVTRWLTLLSILILASFGLILIAQHGRWLAESMLLKFSIYTPHG